MSISDELMGRYWTFLTDLRQSEIERMQSDVASGALHPMEAKKRLARTIVAGFHSEEAARKADENWAMQFQQRNVEALAEEVAIHFRKIARADAASLENFDQDPSLEVPIDVGKLLVELGIKSSRSEADRQVAAGVNIDGVTGTAKTIRVKRPARIVVRVGKQARIAVVE
jgi:tyrosyl-tRNA synthetase